MKDNILHINPEDCSDPNKIGLDELILLATKKLPRPESFSGREIRIPIQKPIELNREILSLNVELMRTNPPFDPMSSCWILLFRKSINSIQWEFVRLEE